MISRLLGVFHLDGLYLLQEGKEFDILNFINALVHIVFIRILETHSSWRQ